jgi:2,3-dihydroxy-p-cumate/2,3-dihydroxybenzoate 3,4-dioxygenase
MTRIEQLRYVRLGTRDLAGSVGFAQSILGLQLVGRTDTQAYFRSDYRDHTLVYVAGSDEQIVGMEVRDLAALEVAELALAQAGRPVERGSAPVCADRKVKALLAFTDASGNRIELVVRPLDSGWRYFPARDAGVTGLAAVALRGPCATADERLWTTIFAGRVSDWVGDAAYIGFDDVHHRLAIHPAEAAGILAVEFAVEGVDQLMQSWYFLNQSQIRIAHGPGRRPTSEQMFVTFRGPDNILYSYVAEGARIADPVARLPRQFAKTASSFCAWGSESDIGEFR